MDTVTETRKQIIKEDIAVLEQAILRLKAKRAKLLELLKDED